MALGDSINDGGALADTAGAHLSEVVGRAQERFQYAQEWMAEAQKRWQDDYKFAVADPDNGYQWPNDIRRQRDVDERPCLTINRTRQHNLLVINNLRRSMPSIEFVAAGGGATKQSADVWNDLARSIQYNSNFDEVAGMAIDFQVQGGLGYWLVTTDYSDEKSFTQEIFLEGIKDPLGVYLDPDIQTRDGSDAMFGFVFKNIPNDQFEQLYPDYLAYGGKTALGSGNGWLDEDHTRVARYYEKELVHDELCAYPKGDGTGWTTVQKSKLSEALWEQVVGIHGAKTRKLVSHRVKWYLIVGETAVEEHDWPGKYIPIVRLPGQEHTIDGIIDMVSHTRALKDAQRMYNYWTSSAVEHVALQSKVPWIVDARAIEGYEDYWATANTENYSYLPFNGFDDTAGKEIPPPTRLAPPVMASAYIQGMQIAQNEMMLVSGQHEAEFGQQTPERSGVAIQERQEQSDNATFHFMENLAMAIRFTGQIIMDLAPSIYDVAQVRQIVAENGASYEVMMDPYASQAYAQRVKALDQTIQHVFNPTVGKYDVRASVGPNYGTRREAAHSALLALMTQAPSLIPIIGDLMIESSDWPMSDEAAERMRRMVPPQALGEPPHPVVQHLQGALQQAQGEIQKLQLANAKHELAARDKLGEAATAQYNAETQRMKVTGEHIGDANELEQTIRLELTKLLVGLLPPQQAQAPAQTPSPQPNGAPQ